MLSVRLLVNSTVFGGTQKLYVDFQMCQGWDTPNPCVAQGLTTYFKSTTSMYSFVPI